MSFQVYMKKYSFKYPFIKGYVRNVFPQKKDLHISASAVERKYM